MNSALVITGVVLAVFGLIFVLVGRSGERGYWEQRDPQEVAGQDDVTIGQVQQKLGYYATKGKRPSLRLMAIGLILLYVGILVALIGILVGVFSK
jgi:hypothetical protein